MKERLSTLLLIITAILVVVAWLFYGLRGAFASLSLATFLIYGLDKVQAMRGKRRVSEWSLHLLALAGGTPGAALGQVVFRHKTQKKSFRRIFSLIVFIQAVALTVWVIRSW